jgi:hypothetical protein
LNDKFVKCIHNNFSLAGIVELDGIGRLFEANSIKSIFEHGKFSDCARNVTTVNTVTGPRCPRVRTCLLGGIEIVEGVLQLDCPGFEAKLLEANPYIDLVLCSHPDDLSLNFSVASEAPKELADLVLVLFPIH